MRRTTIDTGHLCTTHTITRSLRIMSPDPTTCRPAAYNFSHLTLNWLHNHGQVAVQLGKARLRWGWLKWPTASPLSSCMKLLGYYAILFFPCQRSLAQTAMHHVPQFAPSLPPNNTLPFLLEPRSILPTLLAGPLHDGSDIVNAVDRPDILNVALPSFPNTASFPPFQTRSGLLSIDDSLSARLIYLTAEEGGPILMIHNILTHSRPAEW